MKLLAPSLSSANLKSLAEEHGTPLYVYSGEVIGEQFHKLKQYFADLNPSLCYAVKANSNLGLLSFLDHIGSDFDVVSEGELRRLLEIGVRPDKIIFEGVGKYQSEIEFAALTGVRFISVESEQELHTVQAVSEAIGKQVPVALRLNPDVALDTHRHLSTGKKSDKFGIDSSQLGSLVEILSDLSGVSVVGVHAHIGSGGSDVHAFLSAYKILVECADSLKAKDFPVRYIDFGGGFRVPYSDEQKEFNFATFTSGLKGLLEHKEYDVIFEPGKFLVTQSGIMLSRVLYTKETRGEKFVIIDAGLNDLIRPALYDAVHRIEYVAGAEESPRRSEKVHIGGPICESGCMFAKDLEMPELRQGDIVAIRDAGAYCFSMASNYNTRPRPAELFSYKGEISLVREREKVQELWNGEHRLEF